MSVSTLTENYIGLSVTREFVEWETRGESHTAVNAPECLARLAAALARETEPPHVVCERADGAERVAVAFLLVARHRVSLAEPQAVCACAQLADASAIDSAGLAAFAHEWPEKLHRATATQFPPSLLAAPRRRRRVGWFARWLRAVRGAPTPAP